MIREKEPEPLLGEGTIGLGVKYKGEENSHSSNTLVTLGEGSTKMILTDNLPPLESMVCWNFEVFQPLVEKH